MAQVIAVAQSKGGAGKTTTTICLAAHWVRQGERVAVIDADAPQHTLTKWIAGAAEDSPLRKITLVTAPADLPAEIGRLAENHDRILVDMIGADADVMTYALANCDVALVPVQDSPPDVEAALTTWQRIAQAEQARGSKITARIVLTRTQPTTALYDAIREQLRAAGLPLTGAELVNRVAYKEGMMQGATPSIIAPRSPAAREVAQLARELEALV